MDAGASAEPIRLVDFRTTSAEGPRQGFAHDPHVQVGCPTCHVDPPGHGSHASVECGACHDSPGGSSGDADVPADGECMSCHHAEVRRQACTDCHGPPAGLPSVAVELTVDVAGVFDDPVRSHLFSHRPHLELECRGCHRAPTTLAVDVGCATCHRDHHRPDANCAACHAPLAPSVHRREAHEGCGGAGCHRDPTVLDLPSTRPVCLVCHQEQVDHQPGRECAPCHQLGTAAESSPQAGGGPGAGRRTGPGP